MDFFIPDIKHLGTDQIISKTKEVAFSVASPGAVAICAGQNVPTTLGELNVNNIYASNVSVTSGASLAAYGFGGTFSGKDVLVAAFFIAYKDYPCGGAVKRAMAGIKLYVHASDIQLKLTSPSLPQIAAAVQLDCAKAEYSLEIIGISAANLYPLIPSAQFNVDTYSTVIAAYDNMVHSLTPATPIDPIIADVINGQIITK